MSFHLCQHFRDVLISSLRTSEEKVPLHLNQCHLKIMSMTHIFMMYNALIKLTTPTEP